MEHEFTHNFVGWSVFVVFLAAGLFEEFIGVDFLIVVAHAVLVSLGFEWYQLTGSLHTVVPSLVFLVWQQQPTTYKHVY